MGPSVVVNNVIINLSLQNNELQQLITRNVVCNHYLLLREGGGVREMGEWKWGVRGLQDNSGSKVGFETSVAPIYRADPIMKFRIELEGGGRLMGFDTYSLTIQ